MRYNSLIFGETFNRAITTKERERSRDLKSRKQKSVFHLAEVRHSEKKEKMDRSHSD